LRQLQHLQQCQRRDGNDVHRDNVDGWRQHQDGDNASAMMATGPAQRQRQRHDNNNATATMPE
jgi:hypothetical protein